MHHKTASASAWTEAQRLAQLNAYGILDTPQEKAFDDIVKLLSELLDVPIAAVNLLAEGRQWFKSEIGLGVREMPLDDSICKFALLQEDRLIVPDTLEDARFNCNPLVTGAPGVRFYAGELLKTPDGVPLGTLCVLDLNPRQQGLTSQQEFILKTLAQQVMSQIELRKVLKQQQEMLAEHERTQKELRLERDQSQRLLEGMDEGFIFLDEHFHLQQINSGGLKFELRPASEMIGRSHWEVWPGSENLPLARHYKRAMKERIVVNFEQNYIFPDGRSYWIDVRAYPANNGLAVFYRDITDRKEAENKLKQTAERLEFTLQAAQIGDWDLNLLDDTSYRSLRHDQCFGYAEPIPSWGFETFIRHVHPEDRDFVTQQFQQSLNEFKDWHFECRVIWPDQSVHWIAAHGSIYHVDAKPAKMSGIVYDITPRKVTEQALRESQHQALEVARQAESERRRLDALLNAAPVGIIVADATGRLMHVNAENQRLWGNHPMSSAVSEYTEWKGWWADGSERHGQRLEEHEWSMARALAGDDAPRQIIEIEPFDAPSDRRIVLNSGAPIRDDGGQIVGAVVAQMDITDQIRAEQALREADQRKDEFLAMLAHELRNPLAPISAAAELMKFINLDAEHMRQTSEIIVRQVDHMTSLINDLLDVSRVTKGLIRLDKTPLDIRTTVTEAIEQVTPLIQARRHHLIMNLAPDTAIVLGDQKRLVQVVANLVNNAVKYTHEGGNILVKTEVRADHVLLEVIDDGIGLEPELASRVFDLFTQAEVTPDRSSGGLGLGLTLVKSLAELHGGTVACESGGKGKGSKFTICLPRFAEPAKHNMPQHSFQGLQNAGQPLHILVVDDNEDAASMLAMLLRAAGHEVMVEHSPHRALERARIEKPNVCVLDIGLPEMDGNELAQRLRHQPETEKSVLIAVTGYGQEHDRNVALAAGFNHHFVKPVDTKKLASVLAQVKSS